MMRSNLCYSCSICALHKKPVPQSWVNGRMNRHDQAHLFTLQAEKLVVLFQSFLLFLLLFFFQPPSFRPFLPPFSFLRLFYQRCRSPLHLFHSLLLYYYLLICSHNIHLFCAESLSTVYWIFEYVNSSLLPFSSWSPLLQCCCVFLCSTVLLFLYSGRPQHTAQPELHVVFGSWPVQ